MSTTTTRQILHVDMDAFYAAVEQRDNPALRGKPVVVGGDVRGVVAAASYEARTFGIHSAMPMREACRRCPELIRVPVRMTWYQSVSVQVFAVFREFTPLIEGLSLDEAFLDVTGSRSLFGSADSIASSIKHRVLERTGLTASVGVAPNKLLAKIASDLDKPDGLVVITHESLHRLLDPLPVRVLPGIGPATAARLGRAGILNIAALRQADDRVLQAIFGRFATRVRERASGIDDRPVLPTRAEKSVSSEATFASDLTGQADLKRQLMRLCERTAERLRRKGLVAGTLQLKIRDSHFATFSRQQILKPPANDTDRLFGTASALLREWLDEFPGRPIRLLGVGGSELSPAAQADLFADIRGSGNAGIERAVDDIRSRFGSAALGRARAIERRSNR